MNDYGYNDPIWSESLADYLRWRDEYMQMAREWAAYTWKGQRTPSITQHIRGYVRLARMWNRHYVTCRRMLNGVA